MGAAAVGLRDRGDQRQAEAGAAGGPGARGVAAGEALEGVVGEPGGESGSVVVHHDPHAVLVRRRRDRHRRAGRGVVPRVAEQVGDHLVQPLLVADDGHRLVGQVELPLVRGDRTRASTTDSSSSRVTSTSTRSSGRPASSRASRSRSSTRLDIRSASVSTFASALDSATGSFGVRRESSAYPWIVASGVRSSWEASPTNWRTWSSLRCRASSERLDVVEQRVQGGAQLADLGALVGEALGHPLGRDRGRPTRAAAAVTAWAVAATSLSGRSCRRTTHACRARAARSDEEQDEQGSTRAAGCTGWRRPRRVGRPTTNLLPAGVARDIRGSRRRRQVDAVHLAVARHLVELGPRAWWTRLRRALGSVMHRRPGLVVDGHHHDGAGAWRAGTAGRSVPVAARWPSGPPPVAASPHAAGRVLTLLVEPVRR